MSTLREKMQEIFKADDAYYANKLKLENQMASFLNMVKEAFEELQVEMQEKYEVAIESIDHSVAIHLKNKKEMFTYTIEVRSNNNDHGFCVTQHYENVDGLKYIYASHKDKEVGYVMNAFTKEKLLDRFLARFQTRRDERSARA